MKLTKKEIYDLNNSNVASQNVQLGTLLSNVENGVKSQPLNEKQIYDLNNDNIIYQELKFGNIVSALKTGDTTMITDLTKKEQERLTNVNTANQNCDLGNKTQELINGNRPELGLIPQEYQGTYKSAPQPEAENRIITTIIKGDTLEMRIGEWESSIANINSYNEETREFTLKEDTSPTPMLIRFQNNNTLVIPCYFGMNIVLTRNETVAPTPLTPINDFPSDISGVYKCVFPNETKREYHINGICITERNFNKDGSSNDGTHGIEYYQVTSYNPTNETFVATNNFITRLTRNYNIQDNGNTLVDRNGMKYIKQI